MAQEIPWHLSNNSLLHQGKMTADHKSLWSLKRWFGKEDTVTSCPAIQEEAQRPGVVRRLSRKVVPGLPRPGTFKRQQSELRDNLEPVKPKPAQRRTVSMDRKGYPQVRDLSRSDTSLLPRTSAPVLMETSESIGFSPELKEEVVNAQIDEVNGYDEAQDQAAAESASLSERRSVSVDGFDDELLEELEKRWILNLSMHFRDKSNREKFFVTFAETPNHWRRVTISLDYRDAPQGSLEEELQDIKFQRDKSARIYESIRDSLSDIQFYDTVTNLKLQTEHDRLHVHVTEDIHEVISYPPVAAISHLQCKRIREGDLVFDSHLSGFVYKVVVDNEIFIKKEIPGPDTVEEFLYEINALHRLSGSDSVIQFGGVITDNEGKLLKGLLISYAEKGALIDVIFDYKGNLPWQRRECWARQIVQGLSEIHEAGFVQGDFTLSNIVIDADDKAKIIDINRRGCPVGWEPPEVAALIESKQRISMYIGVKSDIFQLGMVLWAIAMEQDEPEIQPRPLTLAASIEEIPSYYRTLVGICLSDDPRNRQHATSLLGMFPDIEQVDIEPYYQRESNPDHASTQYIDPATAVGRDDIDNFRVLSSHSSEVAGNSRSSATHTYVNAPTDMSGEPYYYPTRGRSPPGRSLRTESPPMIYASHEHNNDIQAVESIPHDNFGPRVITVSPSGQQQMQVVVPKSPAESIKAAENGIAMEVLESIDRCPSQDHITTDQPGLAKATFLLTKHDTSLELINTSEQDEVRNSTRFPRHDHLLGAAETGDHDPALELIEVAERGPAIPIPIEDPGDHPVPEPARVAEQIPFVPALIEALRLEPALEQVEVAERSPALSKTVETLEHNSAKDPIEAAEHHNIVDFTTDSSPGRSQKPRDTEPAHETIPGDLAGIGQHSTLEQVDFPQGVLDDDLTTDMQ